MTYSNFPFNLFSRQKKGAPGRGRGAKPSPATAPLTPASSRPSSTPGRSGEPTPPKQTTTAPGTAPAPEDVIPIPSDPSHEVRNGGNTGGAEAESEPRQTDLDSLIRSSGGRFSSHSAQNIIGTSHTEPTFYRKKQYTRLPELERWQLANDCIDILMQRVWERPHEQFDAMKKATDDFLVTHLNTVKVNS